MVLQQQAVDEAVVVGDKTDDDEENEEANIDCESLDQHAQLALEFVTSSDNRNNDQYLALQWQPHYHHETTDYNGSEVEVLRLDTQTLVSGTDTDRESQQLTSRPAAMFVFSPKNVRRSCQTPVD